MIIKIFTQPDCPNCPPAKTLGKQIESEMKRSRWPGLTIDWFDTTEVDGMAEAAFYQVMGTPTVLLIDDKGGIVAEWRSKVPEKQEILSNLGLKE
ncbi:MAG TPA: thioredoxin family protein [Candidatus Bathyarchaeia archaeon]|nr:thioredoxin family protein [Candidatus Bathyarchaeia archaeon]